MRVLLKTVLDCDPDDAWRAITSPAVLGEVSSPLMVFTSLEPGGFPDQWPEGEHPVQVSALGLLPVGEQVISISFPAFRGGTRMMRDSGYGRSGVFTVVKEWQHSMAVAPARGGGTLYRDQLVFDAGPITPLLWPLYWAFWQWRGLRMSRLAHRW